MSILIAKAIEKVDPLLPQIDKDARLTAGKYQWGGRIKAGESVPQGTLVVFVDKVYVSLKATDSIPKQSTPAWGFLMNLKSMRVTTKPTDNWFGMSTPLPEPKKGSLDSAMTTAFARNLMAYRFDMVKRRNRRVWRGIFKIKSSYKKGDLVAYDHGVYRAVTGKGIPGREGGWKLLELVSPKDVISDA